MVEEGISKPQDFNAKSYHLNLEDEWIVINAVTAVYILPISTMTPLIIVNPATTQVGSSEPAKVITDAI